MAPGSIFRHSLSHSFHLHYSQIASFFSYASPRSLCTGSSAVERLVYTELVGGSIPSPCIFIYHQPLRTFSSFFANRGANMFEITPSIPLGV
jgi:hypothetical protein